MFLSLVLLAGTATNVAGLPAGFQEVLRSKISAASGALWLSPQLPITSPLDHKFVLPAEDADPLPRRREVQERQRGILYGPSLLGNSSYFPTGYIGNAMVQQHQDNWYRDAGWLTETVNQEVQVAMKAVEKHGGLKELDDFKVLYDGQWQSSVPTGVARGEISNFTSDHLFAMERLSTNPYAIRRLHPTAGQLPFDVDAGTVDALAGISLENLHKQGRLFFVDHSYQKNYPVSSGRYTAACQAYFYLDASSKLLPLAIKTNVGTDLIYTPLDSPNDWLLAKAMFNQNDLFHGQIFHLASSHAVAEIVHQAALRTMSGSHPILAVLDRLMYQAYAIRPVGESVLFNNGGFFDQSFALNNAAVRQFATEFYPTSAGLFRSNYFLAELRSRGLVDSTYGPPLPHFPFFEDGKKLLATIRDFVQTFVEAYYATDAALAQDWELQAWMIEANGPAHVLDFPSAPLEMRETLVDIVTHIAWLGGVSHHVLNAGSPVASSGVLPLHPAALYRAPPERKGDVESLMPWLPNAGKAIEQIALLARFNRPQLVQSQQTLLHMFDDEKLLDGSGKGEVRFANERFMRLMREASEEMSERDFDEQGLSQGMPFVWRGMDPQAIPFFLSV